MSKKRDSQRGKLYKAENAVFTPYPGRVIGNVTGKVFDKFGAKLDVGQAAQLQDKIWNSKRVRARFDLDRRLPNRKRIEIKMTHGNGGAYSSGGRIAYKTEKSLLDWIVVHEMAHEVTRGYGEPGHNWRFADAYLYLVKMFLGADAHATLKHSFKKHKVRFTAPRPKRQLTDEQRAALAQRLAVARAERARKKMLVALERDMLVKSGVY